MKKYILFVLLFMMFVNVSSGQHKDLLVGKSFTINSTAFPNTTYYIGCTTVCRVITTKTVNRRNITTDYYPPPGTQLQYLLNLINPEHTTIIKTNKSDIGINYYPDQRRYIVIKHVEGVRTEVINTTNFAVAVRRVRVVITNE